MVANPPSSDIMCVLLRQKGFSKDVPKQVEPVSFASPSMVNDGDDGNLPKGDGVKICESPGLLSRLEILDISGNPLTDGCAPYLSIILQKCKGLYRLNIERCSISSLTIKKITESLDSEAELSELFIGYNRSIKGLAIVHLLDKLQMLKRRVSKAAAVLSTAAPTPLPPQHRHGNSFLDNEVELVSKHLILSSLMCPACELPAQVMCLSFYSSLAKLAGLFRALDFQLEGAVLCELDSCTTAADRPLLPAYNLISTFQMSPYCCSFSLVLFVPGNWVII
ncbi:tetratricopeptide repeat (TPR)-containing protein [Artemisia annua]|uniref:Tetratricopeptide repeat (TPR)-containing protein n=1 Tax=Artemisia annua TaxID=35608 RepID=A0A2U1KVR0_ARTAN|nr:tetratricopeptide repeat (TPR)-containing protein [Artemisia annua]